MNINTHRRKICSTTTCKMWHISKFIQLKYICCSRGHPIVLGIYKILTCIYSQTQLQVYMYIYYLLWAAGFGLSFRPSSGPLSNSKCSQSEMLKYKHNLIYGIPYNNICSKVKVKIHKIYKISNTGGHTFTLTLSCFILWYSRACCFVYVRSILLISAVLDLEFYCGCSAVSCAAFG